MKKGFHYPDNEVLHDAIVKSYGILDSRAFADELPGILNRLVPWDIYILGEFDMRGYWFRSVIWRPKDLPLFGSLDAFKLYCNQDKRFEHYMRSFDPSAIRISDFLTRRQQSRLPLFVDIYRPLGVGYSISMEIGLTPETFISIALNRRLRDFTEADRLALNLIRPHIEAINQRLKLFPSKAAESPKEKAGRLTALVSADGRIERATPEAYCMLESCGLLRPGCDGLDAEISDFVRTTAMLISTRRLIGRTLPELRLRANGWRGAITCHPTPHPERFVLMLNLSVEAGRSLDSLASERDLTKRETEVLLWVSRGKTNAMIGGILGISARTVNKHLDRVYEKLGVENRTAAAAFVHGYLGTARTRCESVMN